MGSLSLFYLRASATLPVCTLARALGGKSLHLGDCASDPLSRALLAELTSENLCVFEKGTICSAATGPIYFPDLRASYAA